MEHKNLTTITDDELISELHNRVGKGNILATKIWTKDDINLLNGYGYDIRPFNDKELKQIATKCDFDAMEDCTDNDWSSLYDAVATYCTNNNIDITTTEEK